MRRLPLLIASSLTALVCACGDSASSAARSGANNKPRFAGIPKGTTHVFWKAVERGAREGGASVSVEAVWKGPLQENDRAQPIHLVQQFLAEGVDGLALATLLE